MTKKKTMKTMPNPNRTPIEEYEIYKKRKKPGESLLGACKRLGLSERRVSYYERKDRPKNAARRAPAPKSKAASTKRKYTRREKPEVVEIPAALQGEYDARKNQIVMLIGDPETIFNYLGQKGY